MEQAAFDVVGVLVHVPVRVELYVVASAVVVMLLFQVVLARWSRRRRSREQEQHDERERIIRDLHDTLLQSTQGFILTVGAAAKRLPKGDALRTMLERAVLQADAVAVDSRDRIQAVRVPEYRARDLLQSIDSIGREFARDSPARFQVLVLGAPRDLQPAVSDEIHRVGLEALSNAFQHAGARRIEAELIHGLHHFVLRVRDDGCGIDSSALASGRLPGHRGLPCMRERARKIAGRLDVWSRPGAGTEIELRIDSRIAYAKQSRGGWRWAHLVSIGGIT